ncbi:hypothetical protein LAZ67_16001759 [Cordylochernes scorpioides]|uniref:Uncharacterized protein n=1 Tax=Cordylochernes scorpioides TaxID=51811 RepID=A0ABY6LBE8_9ARAC|nr:hypothetical protein LAZ67_16001759 [Cordylochernes scorpioides]
MTITDPEWKDKIITGDETWVYCYDPETKRQSAEWGGQDIAPNDFLLFPKLKAVLKGRHFDTREDIIEKSLLALKSIPKEAYKNCFDNWEKRWRWLRASAAPVVRLPSSVVYLYFLELPSRPASVPCCLRAEIPITHPRPRLPSTFQVGSRMTEVRDDYFVDALTNMQSHCEDLVSRLTDAIRGIAVSRAEEALISPFDGFYAATTSSSNSNGRERDRKMTPPCKPGSARYSKAQLGIKNAPSPSLQESIQNSLSLKEFTQNSPSLQESIQNSPSLKEFTQNFPSLPGSIQTSPSLPDSVQGSPSLTLSLQSSKHNSPTPLQVSVHSLKEAMSPLVEMPSSPGCSKQIPIPIEEDSIESQNRVDNLPSYPMSPEQSYTLSSASVEDFKAQSGPKSPTSPTRGSESCRCSGDYTEPQMSHNSNFSCSSIEESEDNSSKSEENLSRSEDNPNTQRLLRVGGRLKYSYLNENQNFPLLQPKPPRQESLIKNLLTENADIPEAIDENQEDSSILETTFVIEDEESNKDIGTPKIEISEVSVIDKSEGKYSKEPVVSVEALDKKELCHDDPAHLNVVEADLNRPKEATSGIINVYTEANESSSKEKVVPVEIVDTSTKDYLQSGEKAKLSRWKPIDSLCLEDVKESEDDDENYSSSAYIEWPEILKKEVLRPEALEKAVNLEDFEKVVESRQLSKEHLEESTEQGSCIKAESKPWEDPIESDLAAAESDNPASGEKAKLSRWKPIDSLCLEDVKESEDDDENYSSSAYIEWPEILKKEVLRPEALEKAINLEDSEKAAESRQLSKEHLEESTEQGSCIKAESKTWEDPIDSDLAAAESDNPAVPERELANESENLIQDSPQSDTQRWKLIPLPFKQ